KYKLEKEAALDVLEVSNTVREEQIAMLEKIKAKRNSKDVEKLLEEITNCAGSNGNLLEACINASRARATVGEISDAMEKVFGRYVATTQCITGAYASEYGDDETIRSIQKRTKQFMEREGRRPRILVTKMGQDGHDRGIKVIATAYADLGFDVDISPMFQTPEEAAKMAVENDVHIVGSSSLAAGHKTLIPQLIKALKDENAENIKVVVGGVIPPGDYEFLYDAGAVGIFGPGTAITESVNKVLNAIEHTG
ncbi:MAG: cobalamin-dependent protein, partial [Deltaproteobacteria bacterium]|nr:cobalamin-dependent protein [Deltaproteobacteria bacterium]